MGTFFLYAAFRPAVQPIAFVAGFVSIVSFLVLAWMTGGYNPQIARDDMFQLGRHGEVKGGKIAPVRSSFSQGT